MKITLKNKLTVRTVAMTMTIITIATLGAIIITDAIINGTTI